MKNHHYYFIPEPAHTNTDKSMLPPGALIFRIPIGFPSIEEGEGPFQSLISLKTKSVGYKNLLRPNTKRAQKIVQERFIRNLKEMIRVPAGTSYEMDYIKLFEHIGGRIKKGEVTGVHFYDPSRVRVIEILGIDFYTGFWEASIEFLNKKTGQWIKKHKSSSFFPQNWTKERAFQECNYAFENKRKEVSTDSTYRGLTLSGIPVAIVVVNEEVKSLYPLLMYNISLS